VERDAETPTPATAHNLNRSPSATTSNHFPQLQAVVSNVVTVAKGLFRLDLAKNFC
jgi:hypothetical protein